MAWDYRRLKRLAVAVFLVALMAAVALAASVHAAWRSQSDTDAAVHTSLSSFADVTAERVLGYISGAETVTRDLAGDLTSDTYPVAKLPPLLLRYLEGHPSVRAVTAAYPDGSFAIARRDGEGFITRVIDPAADPVFTYSVYDASHTLVSINHEAIAYQPLTATTYRVAVASDTLQWTEPELRAVTRKPGVWATLAVRDSAGEPFA